MSIARELDCPQAREALSRHRDGALADPDWLERHLQRCERCREYATTLDELARELLALRSIQPPAALWMRLEARAGRAERRPKLVARLAAALVGFAGLGGAFQLHERLRHVPDPAAQLSERLLSAGATPDVAALLQPVPEYRLLRSIRSNDEAPR